MSLFPYVFRDMMRPLRMLEQQMKLAEEIFHPTTFGVWNNRPRYTIELGEEASKQDAVIQDKDKFQVKLNLQDFNPEEIVVKTMDGNAIQIEAKHEERQVDNNGFISRQLVRKFMLPKGHDLKSAVSSLSPDGILTITAPRNIEALEEKVIPITHESNESPKENK